MYDLPFDFADVLAINGIAHIKSGHIDNIDCPFCGAKKKMNVNTKPNKNVAKCFRCDWGGGILKFEKDYFGLSDTKEAMKKISHDLNLGVTREYYEQKKVEVSKKSETEVLLPVELRDSCNRNMLALLTLDKDHEEALLKRGMSKEMIAKMGYKSLPIEKEDRLALADKLKKMGFDLTYVAGFYEDEDGKTYLGKFTRGILCPVRNINGQIEGFQIRKDNDKVHVKYKHDANGNVVFGADGKPIGKLENKFNCLSTPNLKKGGKFKTITHYAGDYLFDVATQTPFPYLKNTTRIKVTEGTMKADVYYSLMGEPMLGIQGVKNIKPLETTLKQLREYYPTLTTIEDCMDMDYLTNPNVSSAVEQLREMVESLGFIYIRRKWNDTYKGIDDFALAYKQGKLN